METSPTASPISPQLPWHLTCVRDGARVVVAEYNTTGQARVAIEAAMRRLVQPAIELNPEFTGTFPLIIHVARTVSGKRGLALMQYNRQAQRDVYVSEIFTDRWCFRDCAELRNKIEAGEQHWDEVVS
jgi:hypothetical protein